MQVSGFKSEVCYSASMTRRNAAVSEKSWKTAVGVWACSSATVYLPGATLIVRAPITLPDLLVNGVARIERVKNPVTLSKCGVKGRSA